MMQSDDESLRVDFDAICESSTKRPKLELVKEEVENTTSDISWVNTLQSETTESIGCREDEYYSVHKEVSQDMIDSALMIQPKEEPPLLEFEAIIQNAEPEMKVEPSKKDIDDLSPHCLDTELTCPCDEPSSLEPHDGNSSPSSTALDHGHQQHQLRETSCWLCAICAKNSQSKRKYDEHMKGHLDEKHEEKYTLDRIRDNFIDDKESLKKHLKSQLRQNPDFNDCLRSQNSSDGSKMHLDSVLDKKLFTCNDCRKGFVDEVALTSHMRLHSDKKPLICDTCGKIFYRRYSLVRHFMIHTDDKPYSCKLCNKKFNDENYLNDHSWWHTGKKPFQCEICKKKFGSKKLVRSHILAHTPEKMRKTNLCEVCGRSFRTRRTLKDHSRTHTGEKPHSCSICTKRFIQRGALRRHLKIHLDDKPHSCDFCGKRFIRKDQLTVHVEQRKILQLCSTKARRKKRNSNKKFLTTKSAMRSLLCDTCNRKFHSKTMLIQHMKIHAYNNFHTCQICEKVYVYKGSWSKHMQDRHNVPEDK